MNEIQYTNCSDDQDILRGLSEASGGRNYMSNNILVKGKSTSLSYEDIQAEKASQEKSGTSLCSKNMQGDAMARKSNRKSNKIQVKNIPPDVPRENVEHIIESFVPGGSMLKYEDIGAEGAVYITFDSPETAQQAVSSLDKFQIGGSQLKVDFAVNKSPKRSTRSNTNSNSNVNRRELHLRIVVGSEYVGAIIGKGGQTIKNITNQSRAKVDIHRRDNLSPETMITIRGSPESCSSACREIMKIVLVETQTLNRGDNSLRILCPNSLCGRIIGRKGNVIKGFMEKSSTNIVVSSFEISPYGVGVSDVNNYYADRIISVTGNLDGMAKAEELLSEKMRTCMDQDANVFQQMIYSGLPSLPMLHNGNSYATQPRPLYPPFMGGDSNYYNRPTYGMGYSCLPPQQVLEVIFLYIPEQSVGAVIGSKGQNVKSIMQMSGARIKIVSNDAKPGAGNFSSGKSSHHPNHGSEERKVVITGSAEAQWKAQFYIFEKVKMMLTTPDDIHLNLEIFVPKSAIGRIIGKGGQNCQRFASCVDISIPIDDDDVMLLPVYPVPDNIKEMQRVSGAIVQVPEDQSTTDEVPVSVIGHFYACQSAQRRIRSLMVNTAGGFLPRRRSQPHVANGPVLINGN